MRKSSIVKCDNCEKEFLKPDYEIKRTKNNYCSEECRHKAIKAKMVQLVCDNSVCGKLFERPESEVRRSKSDKHYCSRSCAVTCSNTENPKRKLTRLDPTRPHLNKICPECGELMSNTAKLCSKCYKKHNNIFERYTIGEVRSRTNKQKHTPITRSARKKYDKSDKPKYCFICGYDKYYDVCHIKPVASFTDDTKIKNINDLSNLVALCPNHHREFDDNLFSLLNI